MRLQGKSAVITGAAGGLGAAISARFAEEGAAVALLDRDGDRAAAMAKEIGPAAIAFHCDVADEQSVKSALAKVAEKNGHIDTIVNNAGVEGANKPTDELELSEWERVMAINATGVFLCTKHAIPYIRKSGAGSIINVSSVYGLVGGGDIPPYHASKGAVRLMSKNDALYYAPDRIRVNSIHPGFIFTKMVDRFVESTGADPAEARPAIEALHPLGTGDPSDIAWGAVYLASDEARWVTGSELVIDGGFTAR
ncbi:SDR family NAD(P)-dependent oxidoreductase [Gordonia sp. SCSIO 19800]|uniref:SDR family NAD(P)-dependent oxidoreductase n=1 Tax=Gordonia sp. SCSIO 19800 TaxID=2826926 RepID=UPI001B824D37|nr:SDR family oxidoreductase [Gordonia sp. SCSIO 19800]MBR7194678.1 SDR family oxidoreductase [Gordonia sp. SCSIO 19800]